MRKKIVSLALESTSCLWDRVTYIYKKNIFSKNVLFLNLKNLRYLFNFLLTFLPFCFPLFIVKASKKVNHALNHYYCYAVSLWIKKSANSNVEIV